jgi:transcription termination factor Rho
MASSNIQGETPHLVENPEQTPQTTSDTAPLPPATSESTQAPARRDAQPAAPGGGAPRPASDASARKYYAITELNEAKPKDLLAIAKELGVTDITADMNKQDVITRVLQAQTEAQGNIFAQGILEIVEDGFGFLRRRSVLASRDDV